MLYPVGRQRVLLEPVTLFLTPLLHHRPQANHVVRFRVQSGDRAQPALIYT